VKMVEDTPLIVVVVKEQPRQPMGQTTDWELEGRRRRRRRKGRKRGRSLGVVMRRSFPEFSYVDRAMNLFYFVFCLLVKFY